MLRQLVSGTLIAVMLLAGAPVGQAAAAPGTVAFTLRSAPTGDSKVDDAAAKAVAAVVAAINAGAESGKYVAWQLDANQKPIGSCPPRTDCTKTSDIVVFVDVAADGTLTFWPTRTKNGQRLGVLAVPSADAAKPTPEMIRRILAAPMPAQADISLGVMFFPVALDPKSNQAGVNTFMETLVSTVNTRRRVYTAWRITSGGAPVAGDCPADRTATCQVAAARILVRTAAAPDKLTFTSFDALNGTSIGTVPVSVDTTASAVDASKITDDVLRRLLGTASVVDGDVLAVNHGFEQYIELVPEAPATATDPDYGYYLETMLRERGISAFRSAFTTVSLNAASDDALCNSGQRYLVYSVAIENDTKKLLGHTRLSASATGTLLDCVGRKSVSIAGQRRINVPTTANTVSLYSAVLLALYSKFGTRLITFGPAFGALVDADATSVNTRGTAAAQALQRMVDSFCTKLPLQTPAPSVIAAPSAAGQPAIPPGTSRSGQQAGEAAPGARAPAGAPAQAAGPGTGVPFNPGPITGPTAYSPACTDPKLSRRTYDPVHGILTRHWFDTDLPTPTPSPSPSPTPTP